MTQRFTIDGSHALEERLSKLCADVRTRVLELIPRRSLHAIVLGGGYGRGEGGVLVMPGGHQPYNDLEFYLLLRGSDLLAPRCYRARLAHLAEELSSGAGIEVELKLLSLRKLQRSGVSMFYYDLVSAHRLIEGGESWLAGCEHHRAAHRIPLHEATRLLMNRCSGLLFAQDRLARQCWTANDADFVGRNLAKAKLAFGDVLLTMRGQYHWSCRERHRRLTKLAAAHSMDTLVLLHEQGVNFKLHPVRTERSASELRSELDFLKELGRELWLDLESRRLAKTFQSIQDYAADPGSKCPETASLKNRLINARTYGASGIINPSYPRERLLRSLPLLLWHPGASFRLVQTQLQSPRSSAAELVLDYESLWKCFN
jgi:hypothetical protein